MTPAILLLIFFGLVFLVAGAEALVRGSSRLARSLGISPLIVGLTVVAYGTSTPEMAVSIKAALAGQGDIALGNVVGSNIFNVLFILGVSALIVPLIVSQQLVRYDVPIMIGVSLAVFGCAADGNISRLEGALLLFGIVLYTCLVIWLSRKETMDVQEEYAREYGTGTRSGLGYFAVQVLWVAAGLAILVLGARWFVQGAADLARFMGVSELVIGLTVVAAGTSLPEVATSIMAAVRGERDIAVGNVVGSNIYNLLVVLGAGALAAPEGLPVPPALLWFDVPVMIAVAVACLPIFLTGNLIARWEGAVFLFYYAAYTLYLILQSVRHDSVGTFGHMMMTFVVPLTALTLILTTYRHHASRERRSRIPRREVGA